MSPNPAALLLTPGMGPVHTWGLCLLGCHDLPSTKLEKPGSFLCVPGTPPVQGLPWDRWKQVKVGSVVAAPPRPWLGCAHTLSTRPLGEATEPAPVHNLASCLHLPRPSLLPTQSTGTTERLPHGKQGSLCFLLIMNRKFPWGTQARKQKVIQLLSFANIIKGPPSFFWVSLLNRFQTVSSPFTFQTGVCSLCSKSSLGLELAPGSGLQTQTRGSWGALPAWRGGLLAPLCW